MHVAHCQDLLRKALEGWNGGRGRGISAGASDATQHSGLGSSTCRPAEPEEVWETEFVFILLQPSSLDVWWNFRIRDLHQHFKIDAPTTILALSFLRGSHALAIADDVPLSN